MLLNEIVQVRQDAVKNQQKRKDKKTQPEPEIDISEPEEDIKF